MSDPVTMTHLDDAGRIRMVDVTAKAHTVREAVARAVVALSPAAWEAVRANALGKGELAPVVRLAGIQAAKRTPDLIPLAHPLNLTAVAVDLDLSVPGRAAVTCTARCDHATGVEMEAMTGAAVAALAVYDMVKGIDKSARIEAVELLRKSGGKSGEYVRPAEPAGRLVSINVSPGKGTKKEPVGQAVLVAGHGIEGDAHAGGGRQVSLLSLASVEKMIARGAAVVPGDFAENITFDGFTVDRVAPGDAIAVADALLEVTQIGKECHDGCWIKKTVGDCIMPREGFFVRVVRGGGIRPGDPVRLIPAARPAPAAQ